MPETHRILDLSLRVMEGDPWHAGNIVALLEDVTAAEAAAHAVRGAHSIWELVLHMTAWVDEVRERVAGAPAGNPAAGDWPRVGRVNQARWEAARAALFESYDALHRDVSALAASDLPRPVVDPRRPRDAAGMSRYVTIHGVIHHAVYHAGSPDVRRPRASARGGRHGLKPVPSASARALRRRPVPSRPRVTVLPS